MRKIIINLLLLLFIFVCCSKSDTELDIPKDEDPPIEQPPKDDESGVKTVSTLTDLLPYLGRDNVKVKLAPGKYTVSAENISNGSIGRPSSIFENVRVLLPFEGSNSHYDFTDVKLEVKTEVFKAFGNHDIYQLHIIGNSNVIENLTMEDVGELTDNPTHGTTNIVIDGMANRVENIHMTTKGSWPYGYGDVFGKGGTNNIIRHRKHSSLLIRGLSNHVKNCSIIHRSYGHAIFMQGADKPIVEGCYVEGEMRSTDDMLAEEGTGSPADKVGFMTTWGYKLPGGYMLSTGEEGIRAYDAGRTIINGVEFSRGTSNPTILNCTVKNMRGGITLSHARGTKHVEGCTVIGCESGYSISSGGQIIDCKADAQYGPVLGFAYETDKNITADITIIPPAGEYYNGTGSVAYIAGSGHNITLRASQALEANQDIIIKVGGDKNSIRHLYGSLPHQNDHKSNNITLNNLTSFPLFLSDKSSNIVGESYGAVTDL